MFNNAPVEEWKTTVTLHWIITWNYSLPNLSNKPRLDLHIEAPLEHNESWRELKAPREERWVTLYQSFPQDLCLESSLVCSWEKRNNHTKELDSQWSLQVDSFQLLFNSVTPTRPSMCLDHTGCVSGSFVLTQSFCQLQIPGSFPCGNFSSCPCRRWSSVTHTTELLVF